MITPDCMRGVLVAIEGPDRAGKSTQARMLAAGLRRLGLRAAVFRFPDRSTPTGRLIDRHLRGEEHIPNSTLQDLFVANRREAAAGIRAAVAAGAVVVLDRYCFSGVAYGAASGLSAVECAAREEGLPAPDLVVCMDVLPGEAGERDGYGDEVYDNAPFQSRVRAEFARMRDESWLVVDGSLPAGEAHAAVLRAALEALRAQEESGGPLGSM